MPIQTSGPLAADTEPYKGRRSVKRHTMKSKGKTASPKQLKGLLKQADTMSDKATMGNKRKSKARDKRLERASV